MDGLNGWQQEAVMAVLDEHGGGRFIVERDEPHDEHAFVTFIVDGGERTFEKTIEGDGEWAS